MFLGSTVDGVTSVKEAYDLFSESGAGVSHQELAGCKKESQKVSDHVCRCICGKESSSLHRLSHCQCRMLCATSHGAPHVATAVSRPEKPGLPRARTRS
eukprot:1904383-Amphidinium_carterae.1